MTLCRAAQRDLLSGPTRLDDFIRIAKELSKHLDDPYDRSDFVEVAQAMVAATGDCCSMEAEVADLKDEVRELQETNDELESQVDELESQVDDLNSQVDELNSQVDDLEEELRRKDSDDDG